MKKVILSLLLASLSAIAWALPTVQDVEAEVRQGRYAQAESMMREVVAAKPGSARAHYIYAEILAHDGKLTLAIEEASRARQIDPDVKFADPEKFRTFEASLLRAQAARATPPAAATQRTAAPRESAPVAADRVAPAAAAAGPSWVWLAGGAAIAFALWRFFSRRRAASPLAGGAAPSTGFGSQTQAGAVPSPYGPGATPPYGPGYAPQRPGSGMMGVSLAAAGGVAAGMLAERMLHGRNDAGPDHETSTSPGFFDSPASGDAGTDLGSRPIDFGTGGADWDSGSSDAGGGSSDNGGGWG
jgi:hypothetical protein